MASVRLPRVSHQPAYDNVKYSFTTGFGFHVTSQAVDALHSRYVTMSRTNNYLPAHIDCLESAKSPQRREREKHAATYVAKLRRGTKRVEHTVQNLDREEMYRLEQFQTSVDLHTDPAWYNAMLTNKFVGSQRADDDAGTEQHVCLGFQRFMQLDMISMMIDRSGLAHHRRQILARAKHQMGLDSLTVEKIDELQRRLNVRVVGHNIRRREGKSVSVYVNIAIMLVAYPTGNLLGLYTVHTIAGTSTAYQSVAKHVPTLVDHYNEVQLSRYNARTRDRGGRMDPDDYYYRAEFATAKGEGALVVRFFKYNTQGVRNDGVPVNENSMRFRTCAKEDVSTIQFLWFMFFLIFL